MSLIVQPTEAAIVRQVDRFNRLEAFCLIRIGPQFRKTRASQEGGKRPRWNQPLQFVASREPLLKVEVWSQQILIGQGHLQLAKVYNSPNAQQTEIVQLWFSGGNAGRIQLLLEFQNGKRGSMSTQNLPVAQNNKFPAGGQLPEVNIQTAQNQNIGTLNPIHSAPKNNVEVGKPQPPPGMENKMQPAENTPCTLQQVYGVAIPQIPQGLDPHSADINSIFQFITGRKLAPKPIHSETSPPPEHFRKANSMSTEKAMMYPQITQTVKHRYSSTKHDSIYPTLEDKANPKQNKSDWQKYEPSQIKEENEETVSINQQPHPNVVVHPTQKPTQFSAITDLPNNFKSQNPYNQKQQQLMTARSMYPGQKQMNVPTKRDKVESQAPSFVTDGDRGIPSMYPTNPVQQHPTGYYPSVPAGNYGRHQNYFQQR